MRGNMDTCNRIPKKDDDLEEKESTSDDDDEEEDRRGGRGTNYSYMGHPQGYPQSPGYQPGAGYAAPPYPQSPGRQQSPGYGQSPGYQPGAGAAGPQGQGSSSQMQGYPQGYPPPPPGAFAPQRNKQPHYDIEPVLMDLNAIAAQKRRMAKNMLKIKDVTSNANILTKTNPEIFNASPRAGGYLRIDKDEISSPPPHTSVEMCRRCSNIYDDELRAVLNKRSNPSLLMTVDPMTYISMRSSTSREFRIKRALEETEWETTVVDETDTVVGISNPVSVCMNMLAVTITCIMMMAAKAEISKEYLHWGEAYLRCIKDENGKMPRNIAGLIKEIKRRKGKIAEKEELEEQKRKEKEGEPQEVPSTTTEVSPKASKTAKCCAKRSAKKPSPPKKLSKKASKSGTTSPTTPGQT